MSRYVLGKQCCDFWGFPASKSSLVESSRPTQTHCPGFLQILSCHLGTRPCIQQLERTQERGETVSSLNWDGAFAALITGILVNAKKNSKVGTAHQRLKIQQRENTDQNVSKHSNSSTYSSGHPSKGYPKVWKTTTLENYNCKWRQWTHTNEMPRGRRQRFPDWPQPRYAKNVSFCEVLVLFQHWTMRQYLVERLWDATAKMVLS